MNSAGGVAQRGMVLIVLLLALLLGSASVLLVHSAGSSPPAERQARQLRTQHLLQARQALLHYTVAYADNYLSSGAGPGHLPCPDRSPINDGNLGNDGPDPPCRAAGSNIGRLPRLTYARDQSDTDKAGKRIQFYPWLSLQDRQMWYAVSRSHINNPVNTVVNPSTRGRLRVDSFENIAAVIIDPGADLQLDNALRPGDAIAAYLEGENADLDSDYTQNPPAANDQLVYISAEEISRLSRLRVGQFVKRWLREYSQRHCPEQNLRCFPAAANQQGVCEAARSSGYLALYAGNCQGAVALAGQLDNTELGAHWFVRNNWLAYFRYRRSAECEQSQAADCVLQLKHSEDPQGLSWLTVVPAAEVQG